MHDRLEQLLQIQKMCLNEMKQAQENCEQYSASMWDLTKNVKDTWQTSTDFLIEYDSFITNITTIMDATRKFKLQLHLYNAKLVEVHDAILKINKKKESPNVSEQSGNWKEKTVTKSHFLPAEEFDLNSETSEDFIYPSINLNSVYKVNDVVSATVTYIKNLKDLNFYIIDNSSKHRETIVELSKKLDLRQYHGMPATSEVFGCVLDNQIFRAVLGSKTYYDMELNEEIVPCYIIDTGEILPLKSDTIMYRLNEEKNIPALAVPCKIKLNKNPFLTKEVIEDKLRNMVYEKCSFKVLAIKNNTLYVDILENPRVTSTIAKSNTSVKTNTVMEAGSNKTGYRQVTEEELNILYEEPLSTSNPMKAVMGYDPQDDKRICRFYNPLTGGCFKGVNCKLEHSLHQTEYWTKDILPTTSTIDNDAITIYPSGSIINITPTYVGQMDRFFAQINETHKTSTPLLWNDEDVPAWKLMKRPPHMYEIVLARYVDGLWYRAKVMSHDDEYKMFKVFYVDYGNIQVVHLRNLASIDMGLARLPFQAVLCRFDAVNEKPSQSTDERNKSVEMLCEMILNKSMDVKVISHYEDLFISFVDKKSYPLPDVLIEMGYLEPNRNKVLL